MAYAPILIPESMKKKVPVDQPAVKSVPKAPVPKAPASTDYAARLGLTDADKAKLTSDAVVPATDYGARLGLSDQDIPAADKSVDKPQQNFSPTRPLTEEEVKKLSPKDFQRYMNSYLYQGQQGSTALAVGLNPAGAIQGAAAGPISDVAGAIQAGLDFISPDVRNKFTSWVQENTPDWMKNKQDDPGFSAAKSLSSGLLTAATIERFAPAIVGPPLKDILISAGIGGTQFYDDPENSSRLQDTLFGMLGGTLGHVGGSAATKALAKHINSGGIGKFIDDWTARTANMAAHSSTLHLNIQAEKDRVSAIKDKRYAMRDAAGKAVGPVSALAVHDDLNNLRTQMRGSSVHNVINNVIAMVEHKLGISDAQIMPQMQIPGVNPARLKRGIIQSQNIGIEASDVFSALTYVNGEIKKASGSRLKQLNDLKNVINNQVTGISAQSGRSPAFLQNLHDQATKFYKENIVPFSHFFDTDPFNSQIATGKLSPKAVRDKAVTILEGDDPTEINKFKKISGKAGTVELGKILMDRAITSGTDVKGRFDPNNVFRYLTDHKEAVRAILTPTDRNAVEAYGKMLAFGQKVMASAAAKKGGGGFKAAVKSMIKGESDITHHFVPVLMTYFGLEHMIHGDVAKGAELIASGWGASIALNKFSVISDKFGLKNFMAAHNKLPASSSKWMKVMERLIPLLSTVGGAQLGTSISPYVNQPGRQVQ